VIINFASIVKGCVFTQWRGRFYGNILEILCKIFDFAIREMRFSMILYIENRGMEAYTL